MLQFLKQYNIFDHIIDNIYFPIYLYSNFNSIIMDDCNLHILNNYVHILINI